MLQRIITGVIAGALFLIMLIIGRWAFAIFAALMALIAFFELVAMKKIKRLSVAGIIGAVFVAVMVLSERLNNEVFHFNMAQVMIVFAVLLLITTVFSKNLFSFDQAAVTFFSAIYVGFGFHAMVIARDHGLSLVLFILILIWTTDSGAYFVGKAFGKHKLAPLISPNKTVEGAVGGMVLAVIVAFVFHAITVPPGLESLTVLSVIAVAIAVIGQLGDLAESALKRYYNVKDSGHILPGHGGVLDRCDSWIFVFPILLAFNVF
ncbi:phosphatidate cytidylyltransferase [Camelliibacillus cellulosilyticus]|uniref:Phosphatidate cytidylyltransferase n=1 Tax=Camelliibacillus cellulosilyticus TaxID=2174486 RepID=A0ABV9GL25_9BACL